MTSNTERITDPKRMAALLHRLKQTRIALAVHFPDHNVRYSSTLLEIDDKKRVLSLDELIPRDGNNLISAGQTAHVTAKLAGASIHFRGTVVSEPADAATSSFVLTWPDRLLYEQRRATYRIRVGSGMIISVTIRADSNVEYPGYLFDISSNGIGAYFEMSADLVVREQPYACKIDLPGGKFISGAFKVRFLKQDTKLQQLLIGGQFLDLPGPQRQALDRFVMTLQRNAIKKSRD